MNLRHRLAMVWTGDRRNLAARSVVLDPAVLVGQPSPAPQDHGRTRRLPELGAGIELLVQDLAAVAPVVAQVKGEAESVPGLERRADLQRRVINPVVLAGVDVGEADPPSVCQLEHVKVGEVPSAEGDVDGLGETLEGQRGPDREHAPGWRVTFDVESAEQLDLDLQPCPRQSPAAYGERGGTA